MSFPFARSIYPICILPRISDHAAAGETNLEIEGAGTGAIHIADGGLFVPAVSATQRDLLQAVQLRLGRSHGTGDTWSNSSSVGRLVKLLAWNVNLFPHWE